MEHSESLLEGNIARQLLVLAAPLLIGNIFQQFYNTIDAVIIGRYVGEAVFANGRSRPEGKLLSLVRERYFSCSSRAGS